MHTATLPTLSPIAKGTIYHGNYRHNATVTRAAMRATQSDSGMNWAYFYDVSLADVLAWGAANGWEVARVDSPYDCSGEYFARTPWVDQVGKRLVLRQSWGYDV